MRKISAQRVIGTLVLLLFAALVLLPLFWLGVSAFKSDADVIKWPPIFFPTEWVTTQFAYVWKVLPIARMLLNTVVFAGGVTIISLFFDSMAAYAFARMKFTGRKLLFGIILLTMMIPFQVIMVPLYLEVYYLKWLNTYWGLIIPKVASAYWIFLCRAAFQELPKELEDAARIDGLGEFGIFWKIMLPLVKPTMITMLLLGINNCWNDLLWPLIVANASTMRTLSNGLAIFIGDRTSEYSLAFTAATVSMLPMLILYIFGQKYFVAGQVSSGIKG